MAQPNIYQMSGGYGFRMDIGRNPKTGKRERPRFGPFRTKKEAQLERSRLMQEVHEGSFVRDRKLKFKEFAQQYLDHKSNNVEASTFAAYKGYVNNHLVPAFGEAKLHEIKPVHIQQLYDDYVEEEKLSNQSITHMHRIFNNAFKMAMTWELTTKNPCNAIKPPKPEKYEMQVWDTFEVQHFLEHVKGERFYIVYLLALTTGMRRGEILALRWQDIDFRNGMLSVRQAVKMKKGGGYFIGRVKTESSERTISLFDHVLEELQSERKKQMSFKMEHRQSYEDQDLVVSASTGTFVLPRNFDRSWRKAVSTSSLKSIRFHDLRHTHATLMLQQGVHPKIVQERLGHSSITVTLDLYSHVLPNLQKSAAENFGEEIFGPQNTNRNSL